MLLNMRTGNYQTAVLVSGIWARKGTRTQWIRFLVSVTRQGEYFDPYMIEMGKTIEVPGYATNIITEKSLSWLKTRNPEKPFFLMCLHKAPHREWEPHPKNRDFTKKISKSLKPLMTTIKIVRKAAKEAKMRIKDDMKYSDLGLVQPEGGSEVGGAQELAVPIAKSQTPQMSAVFD